jgi:hypothetical protein
VERRGQAIRVMIDKANWQQEEPTGCGGGRQLSMDGTSRVTGDYHARFCERLGVKFPGATRRAMGNRRSYHDRPMGGRPLGPAWPAVAQRANSRVANRPQDAHPAPHTGKPQTALALVEAL